MIAENEKAPQIRIRLLPSLCHVISIHQEHGLNEPARWPRITLNNKLFFSPDPFYHVGIAV